MKKNHGIRTFAAGFLAALLLVGAVSSAVAASGKSITVYPGVSIYMDDVKLNPTDANGKPVEVFIYNGTTYLPVRAVSEALGKDVVWDGSTRSVYVGKHNAGLTLAGYLCETPALYGTAMDGILDSAKTMGKDNLGNDHIKCIYTAGGTLDNTYLLDGKYSRFTATIYQRYESRDHALMHTEPAFTLYGDGEELYTFTPEYGLKGFRPLDIDVSLEGVTELRVVFRSLDGHSINASVLLLGEAALWK